MQVVSTVTTGEYFGQQALWKTNTPRAATAVTKTACVFYTLERTQFQNLLGPIDQIWRFQALQKVRRLQIHPLRFCKKILVTLLTVHLVELHVVSGGCCLCCAQMPQRFIPAHHVPSLLHTMEQRVWFHMVGVGLCVNGSIPPRHSDHSTLDFPVFSMQTVPHIT